MVTMRLATAPITVLQEHTGTLTLISVYQSATVPPLLKVSTALP